MRPVGDDAKRFGNSPLACKELRRKGLRTQATCGRSCRGRRKCGRGNPDSNDHLNSSFHTRHSGTRGAMLRACCPLPRSECPPPRRASLRRLRRRLSALRALPARDETARQLEKVSKPTARSEPGGGFLSLRPSRNAPSAVHQGAAFMSPEPEVGAASAEGELRPGERVLAG